MIELPEALNLSRQLQNTVAGKAVRRVLPPTKVHKFCWFNGDPAAYDAMVKGQAVSSVEAFGIFVEIVFANGQRLCINDGVNVRFINALVFNVAVPGVTFRNEAVPNVAAAIATDSDATAPDVSPAADAPISNAPAAPKDYQLKVEFTDGAALVFTVAMYGGIIMHNGSYANEYYLKSRGALSPFSWGFEGYYRKIFAESKPTLSAKAFLAAEQRFPGIGNGVLQDILFAARIHPKRKIGTLAEEEVNRLLSAVISVLQEMTERGGRDTEKDLFGKACGYKTNMSKKMLAIGCPACGAAIKKEAYLGGTVYYCPACQPLAPAGQ